MKRMMLFCLSLLVVCTSASFAFEQKDFYRNMTGKDFVTWSQLALESDARAIGLTSKDMEKFAPVNRPDGLRCGEWLPKHDLEIGKWFGWYYHLGDEAKVGLEGQAKGLPKNIRPIIEDLIQRKAPVTEIKLKWGQTFAWVTFQVGRKPQFSKNAVALWQNPATGQVISEITAYVWEGTGYGYVTGCFNLFALPDVPKPIPTEAPKAALVPPTPEPTDTPTPEPTKAPPKKAEESLNPLWGQGVVWAVPEYVSADSLSQFNFYGGLEWRRQLLASKLWWTIRGEIGPGWNYPDEGPKTSAQTSSLRTGLRYRLIDKAPVALDIEAGALGWFHSEHYSMFQWDNGPSYLEGDATETSGGGYVRLLGKSRYETYYEVEYRNAGKESCFSGNLSTEPQRFYGEIGGGSSDYSELDDDGTIYRQDGTFTEFHLKAGYKLAVKRPFIVAATYQTWKYSSDVWEIDWSGPGLYIESRFDPKGHWRMKLHGIYFADREDGPPGEDKAKSHETRVQFGLTYSW